MQALKRIEYPGRGIIVGRVRERAGEHNVIAYFITGRRPVSRARKLVYDERRKKILVEPTKWAEVSESERGLLVYPAMIIGRGFVAAGNGQHTKSIDEQELAPSHAAALALAHANWSYEQDAPIYTPRISAFVRGGFAGLGIIRRKTNGGKEEEYFNIELKPGDFRLLTTYAGEDRKIPTAFQGEPLRIELQGRTPGEIAKEIYSALPPEYRVGVAVLFYEPRSGKFVPCTRNKGILENLLSRFSIRRFFRKRR